MIRKALENREPIRLKHVSCQARKNCKWFRDPDRCGFNGVLTIDEHGKCTSFEPDFKKMRKALADEPY